MTNPRRTNGHRRSQLTRQVKAEETDCWLCGEWVDQSLGIMPGVHSRRCVAERRDCGGCVYYPKSPVVDEVLRVADGGSPYDRSNCRLAHRDCNRNRETRRSLVPTATLAPLTTQRSW